MLQVYGYPLSMPAIKVRMAVYALELPHKYHLVDLQKGEQNSAEFLAINPKGKVPAIQDGELCLSESHAILRYLTQKTGKLYPQSLLQQAKADEHLEYIGQHITAAMSKMLFNTLFAPIMGIEVDERALADGRRFLTQQLFFINGQLAQKPFLLDGFSIADIALVAALDPAEVVKFELADFPDVVRWRKRMRSQAWYKACHSHYGAGILPSE